MFSSLKAGDPVALFGPWGDFVLRADSPRSVLFLACDTGFAPVKSLIEHAMALDASERLCLYWLATRRTGHYLANLCRSWADAVDNFGYVPLSAGRADAAELVRRVAAEQADLAAFDIYLAGDAPFVESGAKALRARGFPEAQLALAAI